MYNKVFYSFHYKNDISRAMVVRNRWVTYGGQVVSGVIDKAEFETLKRRGDQAVYRWIDEQLKGTSVTVVLIGAQTLERPFVQYEIIESLNRGNAIVGVRIDGIADMWTQQKSKRGNLHTIIGEYNDGRKVYFDEICKDVHDYTLDGGYQNLGRWVEIAKQRQG